MYSHNVVVYPQCFWEPSFLEGCNTILHRNPVSSAISLWFGMRPARIEPRTGVLASKAGHVTTLPRQQNVDYCMISIFVVATLCIDRDASTFLYFLVPEALLSCLVVVVENLINCRVPSSACIPKAFIRGASYVLAGNLTQCFTIESILEALVSHNNLSYPR